MKIKLSIAMVFSVFALAIKANMPTPSKLQTPAQALVGITSAIDAAHKKIKDLESKIENLRAEIKADCQKVEDTTKKENCVVGLSPKKALLSTLQFQLAQAKTMLLPLEKIKEGIEKTQEKM